MIVEQITTMQTLDELFRRQAEKSPDEIAVVSPEKSLTFRELEEYSDRISFCINKKINELSLYDLPSDELIIGVYFARNINLIAAMLGVLKEGAAFLPLDTHIPQIRIETMINDAHCPLILTDRRTLQNNPWLNKYILVIVDEIDEIKIPKNLPRYYPNSSTKTAYVIYTSGSTGQPKGVLTTHESVVNRFKWLQKEYPLKKTDVCCQKASISYVDSIWELFFPILNGVKYVFIPDEVLLQPLRIIDFLIEYKITRIDCPPSLLKVILKTLEVTKKKLQLLQFWVVSGEEILPEIVMEFYKLFKKGILLNRYGSTEVTSYMWYRLQKHDDQTSPHMPIGKPIDNAIVYALDEELKKVSPGSIGELCVSGICLAKGYLRRVDLENKVFVKNPYNHAEIRGLERLYKTGDLVRQLPSGDYEYIGRVDNRIKFRGHTIEPFEVEDCLRSFSGIQDALVILKNINEEPELIAYLISEDPSEFENDEDLIKFLKTKIPEYMIPNFFVRLDKFPLNTSGKIDRDSLPVPKILTDEENDDAQGEFEQKLVAIWKKVLKIKSISRDCNFFLLGGHSLAAMQIAMEIQKSFSIAVDAADLLRYPTIAHLTSYLSQYLNNSQREYFPKEHVRSNKNLVEMRAYPPLSPMQNQLWILEKQLEGTSNYNMSFVIQIEGSLNYSALKNSFNKIIERYDILRTMFKQHNNKPYQFIQKQLQIDIPIVAVRDSEFESLIREYINIPFDLEKGPLLRIILFQLKKNRNILLINQHHIISDDGSMEIMLNELSLLYKHYKNGESLELPNPVQYKEFCFWHKKICLQDQIAYWKQKLLNCQEVQLITDFPRPTKITTEGKYHDFIIDSSMVKQLSYLAKKNECTLFMLFLALIGVLIFRYTQQEDILIGAPITCRDQEFTTKMLGMLLNTLPFRIDVSGSPSFATLIERTRQMCLDIFANKYVPLDGIISRNVITRTSGKNPLFQIMFAYQDMDLNNDINLVELDSKILDIFNNTAKMDLVFSFRRQKNKFNCRIEYNSALFLPSTIERMGVHFLNLLNGIINYPNDDIDKLSIIGDQERRTLLIDWNTTNTVFPESEPIHGLFEKRVAINPNHIALQTEYGKFTYQELNHLANQIARYLLKIKFKKDLIAICLNRSKEQIAAILAIWKIGSAYVPIDPSYPEERIKYIMEDSCCELIISIKSIINKISFLKKAQVILIDKHSKSINQQENSNLSFQISPSTLAQVLYTSGSTGNPKGVMLEHRSIVNRLSWMQDHYALEPENKFLHKTPFIFDVSVGEIFWPLTSGATIILAQQARGYDFPYLINLIKKYKISHAHFIPNGLTIFLKLIKDNISYKNNLSSLTKIYCSGEELSTKLVNECLNQLNIELHNIYGPTEAGEVSSYQCFANENNSSIAPIGKPINNVRFYNLDKYLNPVPIGAIGELYIGGVALARGYYQKHELTKQKFINHTFEVNNDDGSKTKIRERLYKTGDLVYWLSNGNIVYIGRNDFQVKINGYRIELGEIENKINNIDGISQSIVLMHTINQKKYLVAYFVSATSKKISADIIKQKLFQQLPSAMVPNYIVQIAQFPLTNTGKINRLLLPTPEFEQIHLNNEILVPNDLVEYRLLKIWQKVLGIIRISITDNFFSIGGHSLLSIQLVSMINKKFNVNFTVSWIFEYNHIQIQAQSIREHIEITDFYRPILAFNPLGSTPPLIFIHPGHAGSEIYLNFASVLNKKIRFYTFDSYNLYHQPFIGTISELATKYLQDVKKLLPIGPYYLGGWSLGGIVAYEMAQQLEKQGLPIKAVYLIDSSTYLSNLDDPMASISSDFFNYYNSLPIGDQERYLKLIAHEKNMLINYQPNNCRFSVTIFSAKQGKFKSYQQWLPLVKDLEIIELSANHFSIMKEPQLKTIADHISKSILVTQDENSI